MLVNDWILWIINIYVCKIKYSISILFHYMDKIIERARTANPPSILYINKAPSKQSRLGLLVITIS